MAAGGAGTNSRSRVMNEITIESADTQEIGPLLGLFERQHREHHIIRSQEELHVVLVALGRQPDEGFVLSANCQGSPVGVAYAARILSLEHGGWSGWLEEFYVLPDWRGKGVGSQLLAAVLAVATERGWAALDLEVDAGHRRAISLYQRNRFEAVNRTRFVRGLGRE